MSRGKQEAPFGVRLQRLRKAAGLTQEELAVRSGLTVRGISDLERGERRHPYPKTVRSLAKALGLSEDERASLLASVPRRSDASTPPSAAASRAGLLPSPPTLLIGRERELGEVVGFLGRPDLRLLTLTGPGGVGKTRLALKAARQAAGLFPDGVTFVALASLNDPSLVLPTIVRSLGLRESASRAPLDHLREHLRGKRLLLLLDNFEHLRAAASEIASLVQICPSLVVLATSRSPLRVRGEQEYPVIPLALPTLTHTPDPDEVARSPSGRLLLERVQTVSPTLKLTAANAAAMAAICRRLDGLPLALELVAARARYLAPAELLSRLDRALESGGARDLPQRQQTMRNTLDWSYELLSAGEKAFFRRLSVFTGGFTLGSAEAVGGNWEPGDEEVLLLLGSLVEQSMVLAEDDGIRYRMLEPVRQYALERLKASEEMVEAQQRHAAWALALAEEAEPKLKGPEQEAWLERLEFEHGNLRAALEWSLGEGDVELGLRIAVALWSFWFMHGYLSEGRRWLESSLSRSGLATAPTRAKALNGAGYIALRQGEYDAAKGLLEQSLALYRESGDSEGTVASLTNLGLVALLGQREDIPVADLLAEALDLRSELEDRHTIANLLAFAGVAAGTRRDWKRASALHEESLALFREIEDTRGIVSTLNTLGLIQLVQADYDGASVLFQESLRLGWALDHKQIILYSFFGMAGVAIGRKQTARAVRLWGVAERMSEAHGIKVSPIVRFHTRYEDHLATARSQLAEEAFAAAWEEGRTMAPERAVAYALRSAGGGSPAAL